MTLPASGQLSAHDVEIELGLSGTAQGSANDAAYRALAGAPSGGYSGATFYGKSNLAVNPAFAADLAYISATTGIRQATLVLNSNGTTSATGSGSSSNSWYTPTTAGIGNSVWVKVRVVSTSNSTTSFTGGFDTWTQLSSAKTIVAQNSSSNLEGTGTFEAKFASDASGTNVLGTFSVSWDCGYVP
jgi:hypothetical protein